MNSREELLFRPVSELVELIRTRELSPVELVDASLKRIEELDPQVNAFIQVMADEARVAAKDSQERAQRGEVRPLEGIPIPVKDIVFVAGTPITSARA